MAPISKARPKATPKKRPATTTTTKARPNTSILNFFAKVEKEEALFVATRGAQTRVDQSVGKKSEEEEYDDDLFGDNDGDDGLEVRFNENDAPQKRRRVSLEEEKGGEALPQQNGGPQEEGSPKRDKSFTKKKKKKKKKGPFVDDSDSEDDDNNSGGSRDDSATMVQTTAPKPSLDESVPKPTHNEPEHTLKKEDGAGHEFDHGDDIDDIDDEVVGEEFRERRLMEELDRLQAEETGLSPYHDVPEPWPDDSMVEACPICDGRLEGLSPDDATKHVNACLDGTAGPLGTVRGDTQPPPFVTTTDEGAVSIPLEEAAINPSKRLSRAAAPRPGQSNPLLDFKETPSTDASAFTKLMSGHAENTAWADAAAAEQASRGRQAYNRTCPFYKIMPGFSICVDAFRYGAVQGCSAYFLSHFHSDHYIGLTSSWSHGPIYCSKVTGTLVKQQLRVAAKWVVELDFEGKFDIPGTDGASVTMIPANHCPGSSMFLFEKTTGKGPAARVQRILHCGDFRACPAHVTHPLLGPEVKDAISGKIQQQKIDICYLDTTYLNPRYSFPPQAQVIQACADFCASLSADPSGTDNAVAKRNASRFFAKPGSSDTTPNPSQRLLVVCGTYSIGKERICIAVAKALNTKIYAAPRKLRLCSALDDPELATLLTSNPLEAQVHMQALAEMSSTALQDYLASHRPHFGRVVGFRPSGWNYRPPSGGTAATAPGSVATTQLLHGKAWRARFGVGDLAPQRGSTAEAACYGVPYSEHSSFRELALFVMGLRIERVVPTVNVGSEAGRKKMRGWTDRWVGERRRGGFVVPLGEGEGEKLWNGKDGRGGGVWW